MVETSIAPERSMIESKLRFSNILVLGAGQMGNGIAQVCAVAGCQVTVVDIDAAGLERAKATIAKSVQRLHSKGVLDEVQMQAAGTNISYSTSLDDVRGTDFDFAIEAVTESFEAKRSLVQQLDAMLSESAVLATNTSSISITRLGAATNRPERFVGMHFMNPPAMLELVEVIPGIATDASVVDDVMAFATELGKTPVRSEDAPGFITNRVLMPLINEAFFCLHEGVGTREAIDDAMRLGMKHPLGPLALADLIGLDTCLAIMEVLHADLGDDKYRPCPLLRRYVDAGRLGRKSGRGVFAYGN